MEMEWISVKDKLPPHGDELVLIVVNGKGKNLTFRNAVEIANYTSKDGWILETFPELENMQVTHWMPLPEPPQE